MLWHIVALIELWLVKLQQFLLEFFGMIRRKRSLPVYTFRPYQVNRLQYASIVAPKPRSGHRIVCNDREIYCFGGFNPDIPSNTGPYRDVSMFQELWRFDTLTLEWELIFGPGEQMPAELASHAMLMLGNSILIFGGTCYPFGMSCSNKLHIFNITTRKLKTVATTGTPPQEMYGQAMVIHEEFLYVVGGTTGYDYSCDVHRLNLMTYEWELVYHCDENNEDDPPGRYRHELAYDGERIFVLGGGTSQVAFTLSKIPAFNLRTNTWAMVQTKPDPTISQPGDKTAFPEARKCHSCVQIESPHGPSAVIIGGYDSCFYNDIWRLDLSTLEWRCFGKLSSFRPLFFHDATVTRSGCVYIYGGITCNVLTNATRIKRTTNMYKIWMAIPKLSEMCIEALNFYAPRLKDSSTEELIKLGVPPPFVERLTTRIN
ncbi:kelch domain-containing protein 10 homolog [Phlebotomus argentipes]|uniref:kelch domain-containing protein 10 homolog n=1 Tax=Phlebotomus argentipes TaxID=94469 RepID=UPI002893740E|nr:kelch domain-containing protein 10 homolog [Phlebotomus argentipes]